MDGTGYAPRLVVSWSVGRIAFVRGVGSRQRLDNPNLNNRPTYTLDSIQALKPGLAKIKGCH
jgi:hypothetical protein